MTRPRLGFLGVGWIGRLRLQSLIESGAAEITAIAEPGPDQATAARALAPGAHLCSSLDELLSMGLDGIVIATPSALHTEQSLAALEGGVAVFCQKPLGRNAAETALVVNASRAADRLLDVDLCYRGVEGMRRIRELVARGDLGSVYAADLVFHNAYGPDKSWFYDAGLSGGGCVIDLGIHLVDLALWMFDHPPVIGVTGRRFAAGKPHDPTGQRVEDFAVASLDLAGGPVARLACSWNLSAGCDAVIEATFYGTEGSASLRNVGGSFFDFRADLFRGTSREVLWEGPDAWGGRAIVAWARQLATDPSFDPAANHLIQVAGVIDAIYGRDYRFGDHEMPQVLELHHA
jgi:predicted dehydrogenase